MRWFHFVTVAIPTIWWTGVLVNSQILDLIPRLGCTINGCESGSLRCGPDGTVPSCNPNTGECYCLEYQCDNRQNKCDSTACGTLERAECILNKNGTSCKCIPVITSTYCNTQHTSCSLPYIDPTDIQHFREICQNLGQGYFAETCRRNGECRCDNTSPVCTARVYREEHVPGISGSISIYQGAAGCKSSLLRCGRNQTVPACVTYTKKCSCLKYQCDNLHNNCSSTVCGLHELPECVFDQHGSHCKCASLLQPECSTFGDYCTVVDEANIRQYHNICAQLGSTYFAYTCDKGSRTYKNQECRCKHEIGDCRQNADCPCPAGHIGKCNGGRCSGYSVPFGGYIVHCTCISDEACRQRCPEGEISFCEQIGRKCTSCGKNCTQASDCPGCPVNMKATCRHRGYCQCIRKDQCFKNDDCNRDNGQYCGGILNFTPSCCWTGCSTGNYFNMTCRCLQGSGLSCSNGGESIQLYDACGVE